MNPNSFMAALSNDGLWAMASGRAGTNQRHNESPRLGVALSLATGP